MVLSGNGSDKRLWEGAEEPPVNLRGKTGFAKSSERLEDGKTFEEVRSERKGKKKSREKKQGNRVPRKTKVEDRRRKKVRDEKGVQESPEMVDQFVKNAVTMAQIPKPARPKANAFGRSGDMGKSPKTSNWESTKNPNLLLSPLNSVVTDYSEEEIKTTTLAEKRSRKKSLKRSKGKGKKRSNNKDTIEVDPEISR